MRARARGCCGDGGGVRGAGAHGQVQQPEQQLGALARAAAAEPAVVEVPLHAHARLGAALELAALRGRERADAAVGHRVAQPVDIVQNSHLGDSEESRP